LSISDIFRKMLEVCLDVKKDESLCICFQSKRMKEAKILKNVGSSLCRRVTSFPINGYTVKPKHRKAILSSDVTLFCVDEEATEMLGHSEIREDACSIGRRVAFLLEDYSYAPEYSDLVKIKRRADYISSVLSKAEIISISRRSERLSVKLTSKAERRRPVRITSLITKPGSWGAIPDYAEVAIAPLEESATGKISVDVGITCLGRDDKPIVMNFKDGRLVSLSGNKISRQLEKIIRKYDNSNVLCEVGIGLSHLNSNNSWVFSEKKKLGNIHLGMGTNIRIGGRNFSGIHLDCVIRGVELRADSKKININ
jgi:leucyl aminopeptidase (aminopeptidase T)